MNRLSVIVAAACLALPGCGVAPLRPPRPVSQAPVPADIVDAVVLQGNKALTLSALAYDSVAKAATAGVRAGVISGGALDALKELNHDATIALTFGYTAETAAEKARAAVALDGIVRRIKALVPGSPT